MTSLVHRATPRQAKLFRIIAGAVLDAIDAHPKWNITHPHMAMSIAKRAVGTLTASWPEVLAAPRVTKAPSEKTGESVTGSASPSPWPGRLANQRQAGRPVPHPLRRRPTLPRLHARISGLAGMAKWAGKTEAYEAYVDVLRLIGAEMNRDA